MCPPIERGRVRSRRGARSEVKPTGEGDGPVWFYIVASVVIMALAVCVSQSNLYRHWRRHSNDPGGRDIGWHDGYDIHGKNPGDRFD